VTGAGRVIVTKTADPLYHPELWNVLHATLEDGYRTNNNLEGWNHRFNSLVNEKHPGVFKIVEKFQQDYVLQKKDLLQWETKGELPAMRNFHTYVSLQNRLKNLCNSYLSGNLTQIEFLQRIARNISLGEPNDQNDQENVNPENVV
jgi:hypothetical protein